MRRASQRNSLVTLNEINITPLLDLAFVLLIIFIITRPALEQGMQLDLPKGGDSDGKLSQNDIARVEVSATGQYELNRQPVGLDALESSLIQMYRDNPNLVVLIAADRASFWENGVSVIDICRRNNITRFNIRTKEPGQP